MKAKIKPPFKIVKAANGKKVLFMRGTSPGKSNVAIIRQLVDGVVIDERCKQ